MKKLILFLTTLMVTLTFFGETIKWVKLANHADVTATDVVLIVDVYNPTKYAFTNDGGTANPPVVSTVTISNNEIIGDVADNLKWNFVKSGSVYNIFPAGQTTKWLYVTASNNGVRVGTNTNKNFTLDVVDGSKPNFKGFTASDGSATRYIGNYSNTDLRCYTSVNTNIQNSHIELFKQVIELDALQVATPEISVLSGQFTAPLTASISCATDSANVFYTTDNFANVYPYSAGISIVGTTTLKAWATKTSMTNSDTATRVYTFPTALANVAAFNAAGTDAFVSIAGLSVIRHSGSNLWATDGTDAIHVYGISASAKAAIEDGNVISLAGIRDDYNGFPEMMSPVLLSSVSGAPAIPVADFDITSATTADFGKFVTVKNVKFASSIALENGVAVTSQLLDLSGIDLEKSYDVTGVINYNNATLQLLPTAVVEAIPEPEDPCETPYTAYSEDFASYATGAIPPGWVTVGTGTQWNVNAGKQLYCTYHANNVINTITTDEIDLSAAPTCSKLYFSHREANYQSHGDTLAVYYQIGEGSPVFLAWYSNLATSLQAASLELPLEAFVSNFRLVFEQRASDALGTYVDNIFIGVQIDYDIEMLPFVQPTISEGIDLKEVPFQVAFKLNGSESFTAEDTIHMYVSVDGTIVSAKYLLGPIAPGSYTLNPPYDTIDFSGNYGTFVVKSWMTSTKDPLHANDTVTKIITNNPLSCGVPPYTNTFTNADDIAGALIVNANGDTKTWALNTTGGGVLRYSWGSVVADDWFISKCIELTAGQEYKVSFDYKGQSSSYAESLDVYYGTEQSVAGMTTQLVTLPSIVNTTMINSESSFTATTTGSYYIGFHCYSIANQYNLDIDNLKIEEVAAFEAQVVAITEPSTGVNLTAAETVKVSLKNNGASAITSVDLTLEVDGTIVGTETVGGLNIAALSTEVITLTSTADVSAEGSHVIRVWVDLAGDATSTNDTAVKTIVNTVCTPVTILPWEENFDASATPFPYDCWSRNPSSTFYFHVSLGHLITADSYGTATVTLPPFNLASQSETPVFKFDYIIGQYSGRSDSLTIYYKIGDGGALNVLKEFKPTGAPLDGGNAYQGTLEIPLNGYADNYYIVIQNVGAYSYSTQLDNFMVYIPATNEVEVVAITEPVSGQNLTNAETVKVSLKNNGAVAITSINLTLEVDESIIGTETVGGLNIASSATAVVTLTNTANLSSDGNHTIRVWANLAGDANPANDTAVKTVVNTVFDGCETITTLPWEEPFDTEFSLDCWTIISTVPANDSWKLKSTVSDSYYPNEPGYALFTLGYTGAMFDEMAITPTFDFTAYSYPVLEFDASLSVPWTEGTHSDLNVEVSVNDAPYVSVWDEDDATFTQYTRFHVSVPLTDYASASNVKIAFHYTGDDGAYVYVDNIKVYNNAPDDAEILAIAQPAASAIGFGAAEAVKVSVRNNGGVAITDIDITLEVDGNIVGTENVNTVNIAALATEVITLANTADLSLAGEHSIRVWIDLAGDANQTNDTIAKTVINYICDAVDVSAAPLILDFESGFTASTSYDDAVNQMNNACWNVIVSCEQSLNVTSTAAVERSFGIRPSFYEPADIHGTLGFMFASYQYGCNLEAEDQAIISPKLETTLLDKYISVWVFNRYTTDHIFIGYSTADTYTDLNADFTWTELTGTGNYGYRFKDTVAANVTYVAFRYNGNYANVATVDDIEIGQVDEESANLALEDGVISIYPNPVKDVLTINGLNVKNAEIYDIAGKLVMNGINKNTIDVKNLNIGVYFLKVGDKIAKFVKE
ncbi:hypothetical protein FACS1894178_4890 [Bacteroidia bacterium]|nr:hypothetical protein FACS1894178_4890 [Bacteroidia bacterium]